MCQASIEEAKLLLRWPGCSFIGLHHCSLMFGCRSAVFLFVIGPAVDLFGHTAAIISFCFRSSVSFGCRSAVLFACKCHFVLSSII